MNENDVLAVCCLQRLDEMKTFSYDIQFMV